MLTIFLRLLYIFPRLLSLCLRIFFILRPEKKLIFFLPTSSRGWILEFLWKDLLSSSIELQNISIECSSFWRFLFLTFIHPKASILVFTDGIAQYLIKRGINPDKLIIMYTHNKDSVLASFSRIHKAKCVLFMNKKSLSLFTQIGLPPHKAIYFPVGVDPHLFYNSNKSLVRDIDFCFPVRYVDSCSHPSYYERKNIALIIELSNMLHLHGYSVALLGPGWQSASQIHPNISIYNMPHAQTSDIYKRTKYTVCLSTDEGGFTATIESILSGTSVISHNHGFASDLTLIPGIRERVNIVEFLSTPSDYFTKFKHIHQSFDNLLAPINIESLNNFYFKNLAKTLCQLSNDC